MTYEIIHKLCPNSFLEKYEPRSSFSSYIGLSAIKKAFITQLVRNGIRELPTTNTFKRQVKLYMKSKT